MKKLFYEDPYISSWETSIEKVINKDDKYYIALSETAFYPEAGGQPSDTGTIDDIKVLDLVEEDGVIYHILDRMPKDKNVKCKIDFKRRFDHMQQHSGQHILSSVFFRLYNGKTAGFHLGNDYITIDIALSELSEDMLKKIENTANEIIYKNYKIKTYFLKYEEALTHALRRLPPSKEDIRIVEIENTDCTPCCGTHVRMTGEIGIIKILKAEKYKGMHRIYFKCGERAFLDFQNKHNIISTLNKTLSCRDEEILDRLTQKEQQIVELSGKLKDLKENIIQYEALNIMKNANNNIISKIYINKNFDDIQKIAKKILDEGDYIVLLLSSDNRLLLCHSGRFNINCGLIFKEYIKQFNGKGGGGEKQAQGGFNSKDDALKFYNFLIENYLKNF